MPGLSLIAHKRPKRLAAVAAFLALGACSLPQLPKLAPGKTDDPTVNLTLIPSSFQSMEGWAQGDHTLAFQAFMSGCTNIVGRDKSKSLGGNPAYGRIADWQPVCQRAVAVNAGNAQAVRAFFETNFAPIEARAGTNPEGLFTGYYEPELRGSRTRKGKYQTPLYARPHDLVQVQLGDFNEKWRGDRIAGRVVDGKLVPYLDRAAIVAGGLGTRGRALVYVDDAWEAFSLQVQGSGRVHLDNGEYVRLNFDGVNGHSYTSIGRKLIDRGIIAREKLSMQAIRDWLKANPKQADEVMNLNRSYVFFKEMEVGDRALGAPGAAGVPLIAKASLAIDLRYHALGAPMWVSANAPDPSERDKSQPFRQLMVAADTGGAIRGPVRGDVYWGVGAKAEEVAGRMAHRGRLIILLPKPLAAQIKG